MVDIIEDLKISYKIYGNQDGQSIVFLHGWGQNIKMMEPLANHFRNKYNLVIIDLPGFGDSDEPKTAWSLNDYIILLNTFFEKNNIKNPVIVGHSFGGKLALLYASIYDVNKLIVLASPFKKEISKLSFKTRILKALKKVKALKKFENFAKRHIGSDDYRNASPIMREVLTRHINTDITEQVRKIKCPTLIIWGTNDEAVSYDRALELEKLIPNSGLVTYEGCSHYAYLERLHQTIKVLESFLNSEE